MNAEFFNTQPYLPDVNNSEEYAISLATEIASGYLDKIDDYTRIIDEPQTYYKEKDGQTYEITYYYITFARKINGFFTSDYITVRITSKGTLASVIMGDINAFSNVTANFSVTEAEQSISEKIEEVYEKNNIYDVTQLDIFDQKIVKTPEGDVCLYSMVDVMLTSVKENEKFATQTALLTVLK